MKKCDVKFMEQDEVSINIIEEPNEGYNGLIQRIIVSCL